MDWTFVESCSVQFDGLGTYKKLYDAELVSEHGIRFACHLPSISQKYYSNLCNYSGQCNSSDCNFNFSL